MEQLIKQEQFEIELLDKLNSKRLLNSLIFTGGTMLRLCHGLDRYSTELDFWIVNETNTELLFSELNNLLSDEYKIKDASNKYHTILFEIRSPEFPRALKIEIRKEIKSVRTEKAIAYSRHSSRQVLLRSVRLEDMMTAKIDAFINRKEIRDIFDIEFLLKRGIELTKNKEKLKKILSCIDELKPKDYSVKLASLIEPTLRTYYKQKNFRIVKDNIINFLSV